MRTISEWTRPWSYTTLAIWGPWSCCQRPPEGALHKVDGYQPTAGRPTPSRVPYLTEWCTPSPHPPPTYPAGAHGPCGDATLRHE